MSAFKTATTHSQLSGALAAFEGDLSLFSAAKDSNGLADRQYIFKLGYYNNSNIAGREADLAALGAIAEQRDGHLFER